MIFVSGKHYYALRKHAEEKGVSNVAFVRLEQLCPFPVKELQEAVERFPKAKSEEDLVTLSSHSSVDLSRAILQSSCGARRSIGTR